MLFRLKQVFIFSVRKKKQNHKATESGRYEKRDRQPDNYHRGR
ncbi:hypothetical protein HMPREF9554_02213 [Treponema phagedenis F0421]|nr:hypothetical protein HMPREF9554_02213 [Treponema phagedenis F0421]